MVRVTVGVALSLLLSQFNGWGGIFSNSAVELNVPARKVSSLDRSRTIRLVESGDVASLEVIASGNRRLGAVEIGVNAEVAWSLDSKAFFVTYSDGGNVGTYHVKVVYVTNAGLRVIEPVADGSILLRPKCFDQEIPNVGAIKWIGRDSSRLLIAVEVPPHSNCANLGTFRAFEIALSKGEVIESFSQMEAKKAFGGDLGQELTGADDKCFLRPFSCVPAGMDSSVRLAK